MTVKIEEGEIIEMNMKSYTVFLICCSELLYIIRENNIPLGCYPIVEQYGIDHIELTLGKDLNFMIPQTEEIIVRFHDFTAIYKNQGKIITMHSRQILNSNSVVNTIIGNRIYDTHIPYEIESEDIHSLNISDHIMYSNRNHLIVSHINALYHNDVDYKLYNEIKEFHELDDKIALTKFSVGELKSLVRCLNMELSLNERMKLSGSKKALIDRLWKYFED